MIYDGIHGYVKGALNVPVDTVLAMTIGPISMRNYFNTDIDPAYSITISPGATGSVTLEGTNDIVYSSNDDSPNPVSSDLNPAMDAVWTAIQVSTATSVAGTFATSYYFLRLRVVTSGTGTVTNAWVKWN